MPKSAIAPAKRSVEYLQSLQAWQLKHLCNVTGISSGSKKSTTAAAIANGLVQYDKTGIASRNIKSVDMGVKNLAFCLLQPIAPSPSSATHFRILDWRRMDVLTGEATTTADQTSEDNSEDPPSVANLYGPANLSPVAARLAARLATDHDPAFVLIERQRFRSMGGSAVQEWTLRVNSLEAMLWASLATMRASTQDFFPTTVEMSPARIASFWNARGSDWGLDASEAILPSVKRDADSDAAKRGMEKAEKIAIVRHWLESGAVDVDKAAQGVANAFMSTGRAKKAEGDLVISKKDDLADCVVQGITFSLWLQNRRLLREYLEKHAA